LNLNVLFELKKFPHLPEHMSYDELSREKLVEALKEMERRAAEAEEWESRAKKFKADLENYRKEEPERRERAERKAKEELAEDLIEVMDNLERAMAAADEDTALLQGVKMVSDQLYESLAAHGLERIDAEGQEFDPNHHRAVETREHDSEGEILEQKRPGYRFEDKVLREAEVVVGEDSSG
jgi:molecular chaperone GrpE